VAALFTGNKVLLKSDTRTGVVMENFVKLLLHCGAYPDSFNLIHCGGKVMENILI
jgi:1-pyrroline-5-carboxylate dehydrogenase